MNVLDILGSDSTIEAIAKQLNHFAIAAAALARILVQNDFVKGSAQNLSLIANVLITAITCTTDDHHSLFCRHVVDRVNQGLNGIGIVTVVGNQSGPLVIKHIESTRHALNVTDECGQALRNGVPWHIEGPSSTH